MKIPVEIKFRHMRPSEWIDVDLRKRAEKLATYCRRIHSCHVVVEIPHRHHETGNRFHVSLDVVVPGEEIAVTRSANLHASTKHLSEREWVKAYEVEGNRKDIRVVIRDTFDVARRRLQEYERRRRGEIKTLQRAFRSRRQERIAS
jgi:ribosome-associated translation inhibitor RaiA